MPRDVNGTYSLPAGNPIVSGTLIQSTWANDTMNDLAVAMTDSLSRSGNGGMLSPFFFIDGTETNPSISFANEPSLGFWRIATQEMGLSGSLNVTDNLTANVVNAVDLTANVVNAADLLLSGDSPRIDISVDSTSWAQITLRNTAGGTRLFTSSTGDFYMRETDPEGVDGFTYSMFSHDTGQVRLNYGGNQKLLTTSTGISVTGDIDVTDDIRMRGTSPLLDLESTDTGNAAFKLRNTEGGVVTYTDNGTYLIRQTDAEGISSDTWIRCEPDAGVSLYYGNERKARTAGPGLLADGKLQGDGSATSQVDVAGAFINVNNSTAYSATIAFLSKDNQGQGGINTANGKTPQFVSPSDVRLKDNILPKDYIECIDRFKRINFVTYNQYENILREGASFENEGVIADEYELLYPDGVTTEKDDPFKVKRVGLVHGHDESVAVQYLLGKVEQLEARLVALNG